MDASDLPQPAATQAGAAPRAAVDSSSGERVCKHFARTGQCLYGANCSFRHNTGGTRSEPSATAAGACTSKPRNGAGTGKRRKVYNFGKVGAFRRWLLNVFGVEYLSSGSGVLDVAGGKGEVSFELENLNAIPCTVIDPRELDLVRYQKKYCGEMYFKNSVFAVYNTVPLRKHTSSSADGSASRAGTCASGHASFTGNTYTVRLPRHIRTLFHMPTVDDRCMCMPCGGGTGVGVSARGPALSSRKSPANGALHASTGGLSVHHRVSNDGRVPEPAVAKSKAARKKAKKGAIAAIAAASAVVGGGAVGENDVGGAGNASADISNSECEGAMGLLGGLEQLMRDAEAQAEGGGCRETAALPPSVSPPTAASLVDAEEPAKEHVIDDTIPLFLQSEAYFRASLGDAAQTAWTIKGLVTTNSTDDAAADESAAAEHGAEVDDGEGEGEGEGGSGTSTGTGADNTVRLEAGRTDVFRYRTERFLVENQHDYAVEDFDAARRLVMDCSIIIGMHPDQAAEHMIDFALRNRKPFALLPCCIYSRQFPTRRTQSGKTVSTYAEFVQYLMDKHGEEFPDAIQAVEMDFEGKNVLLYHIPVAPDPEPGAGDSLTPKALTDPAQPFHLTVRGAADMVVVQALSDGLAGGVPQASRRAAASKLPDGGV